MRSLTILRRAGVALVLVMGMLVVGSPPAAATHPSVRVPFAADHERGCWYMFTEGTLDFNVAHWGETQRVDVRGQLGERLVPQQSYDPPCVFGENTFAELVAYIGSQSHPEPVDRETVYLQDPTGPADPVVRRFEFSLFNLSPLPDIPIDRVDVRVCRDFGPWLPAFSCGDWQRFGPDVIGPRP